MEHPWILGQDSEIRGMRRKSADMEDSVLKFVAYSNVDMEKIRASSPKRGDGEQKSLFMQAKAAQGGANLFNQAAGSNMNAPKPGTFAAFLKQGGNGSFAGAAAAAANR